MKIEVERLEVVGSSRIIHFKQDIVHGDASLTSVGTRALRILYLRAGKMTVSISAKFRRQITLDYPRANKHFATVAALQAIMDEDANTRLRVASFRKTVVAAGDLSQRIAIKTPRDMQKFFESYPDGTLEITREIVLNMPTMRRDSLQMMRVLHGIHCQRWDSDRSLPLEVIRLTIYLVGRANAQDPWLLMESLERNIRTEIAE